MGAVMHSIWTNYSMRVCEPELWSEENIAKVKANGWGPVDTRTIEEYLSEKETKGGEDKSFREHVRQHIEKWNGIDDPYWRFDKRIHDWINKVFES